VPFFIKNGPRGYILALLYVAMLAWSAISYRYLGWSFDGRNVISNLSHFFIGMIGCHIASTFKPNALRAAASIAGACILLGLTNWVYHKLPGGYFSTAGLLCVDLAILLFIFAHGSLEPRKFEKHPLYIAFAFLGTLSYGIYAWHSYLMKFIPAISNRVFILVAASIAVAYISYRLIESPALKLKQYRRPTLRQSWVLK
jgi:peptidoglycan/LPS O-acetylase OafA/YrhL